MRKFSHGPADADAWKSVLRNVTERFNPDFVGPLFVPRDIDWDRLVSLDFETYFDDDYTLKKLSTSEYVRDPRFKAQMLGLQIGNRPLELLGPKQIEHRLDQIDWSTHSALAHHIQFDGLILQEHYGVVPAFYYDSLSMARALHSNDIGAGLDEVSLFYGGQGKIKDTLELTRGVRDWSPELFQKAGVYCAGDVVEMIRIFKAMVPKMPPEEMELVDMVVRMFCDPVLKLNTPRAEAELKRELDHREKLMRNVINVRSYDIEPGIKKILTKTVERELTGVERDMLIVKKVIGSNEKFRALLDAEGVKIPMKFSLAWAKKPPEYKAEFPDEKYIYAFSKDDEKFINLPHDMRLWKEDLSEERKTKAGLMRIVAKQERLQALVDTRIAVKSTTNLTRTQRLLASGKDGASLPVYYAFSAAHTHRLGGGDKRNFQNMKRGGELRQCIEAPEGCELVVCDSGQIEARVNAWLWGQNDLLEAFRAADNGTDRDAYCKFADLIFNRTITKKDNLERFIGKTCILGLGFQMGPPKLQLTLAKGAPGVAPVFFPLDQCEGIVNTYRTTNDKIATGWQKCTRILSDMLIGNKGVYGPLQWEKGRLWLPNGFCLQYPDLKFVEGWGEVDSGFTYRSGKVRKKIYGGLLCENIVQALARIIVLYQTLNISKQMRVVLSTHDEAVSCVYYQDAPAAYKIMMREFKTPPPWAPNLPLSAEGGHARNYSK